MAQMSIVPRVQLFNLDKTKTEVHIKTNAPLHYGEVAMGSWT